MQRWLPLVALVVLGALAVVLWQHDPTPPVEVEVPAPSVAVEVPRSRRPTLKLVEDLPRAEMRVRVTSLEDGRPLAGIRVNAWTAVDPKAARQIESDRDAVGPVTRTDASGLAVLELAPGTQYAIFVQPTLAVVAEYVPIEPALAVNEVREVSVAIPTRPGPMAKLDLVLHGRVIERESGAPIRGARVGRSVDWNAIAPADAIESDDDGRFHLAGASWDTTVFGVLKPGFEPALLQVVAGHATPDVALEIALAPVASLRVTALDADGAPIAGVEATLTTEIFRFGRTDFSALLQARWTEKATFRARTDGSGVAVFADLPPRMPIDGVLWRGRDELMRAPEVLTLTPGEERAVTWRIASGCTIAGVALEADGRPAAPLTICLQKGWSAPHPLYFESFSVEPRRFARTDHQGRFAFADVGVGSWWVGPSPKERTGRTTVEPHDAAPHAVVVVVPPATPRVDVEIRVQRGLSITGRVLDPTGAPARHASIVYTRPVYKLSLHASMEDAEGRFVAGPIEAGEYELRAETPGFVASEPVRARAGDTGVELRLRAGGKLRVRVVDGKGTPTEARVDVRPRAPGNGGARMRREDEIGVSTHDGMVPGVYDVVASTPGGLVGFARDVAIEVGAPQVVRVAVEPGARVRVRSEAPWPHTNFSVLAGEVVVSTDGTETTCEAICVAPAGACVVRATRYPEREDFDLPLTLKVGETRDLVFDGAWK